MPCTSDGSSGPEALSQQCDGEHSTAAGLNQQNTVQRGPPALMRFKVDLSLSFLLNYDLIKPFPQYGHLTAETLL